MMARRLGEASGTAMRNVKQLFDAGLPILAGTGGLPNRCVDRIDQPGDT